MTNLLNRRKTIASLLTILFALSCSTFAAAGPDPDRARGPLQASYRDRDDDDRWDHHDRGEARRRALGFGTRAGFEEGRRDRLRHDGFNFRDEQTYRNATLGYRRQFGNLELYRRNFREGFIRGYSQGYRSGGSRW
jgi:hypothetical protein